METSQTLASRLTSTVMTRIQQQLDSDQLAIAPTPSRLHPPSPHSPSPHSHSLPHRQTLQQLDEMKQSKLSEIREIERKEDILKRSAVQLSPPSHRLQRSHFSAEEVS